MTPHVDDPPVDAPPPPYSETDIYSNSAGRSPILGQSHNSLSAVPINDDASSAASNSEVIYTPPLTPHSSHSNVLPFRGSNLAGSNDGLLSPGYPNDQQSSVSVATDHLTSASAEAYFESRPVAADVEPSREVQHVIAIRPGNSPGDFPYQQEWASRDVRPDDWQTFLNYLLPNHVAESNDALIDKKLRAEGIENNNEARSARSEKDDGTAGSRSPVVAQLEQIRLGDLPGQSVDETIREWNEGFFQPRGMTVHIEQAFSAHEEPRMPGSWDQSFNASPSQDQQASSSSRWWRSLPRFETSSRGLRFGGVSIDNDRISIGDRFVADSRGLRIGGLVADDSGLRLNGRDLFGGTGSRAREQPTVPPAPPGLSSPPPMPPMLTMPPLSSMPPMPPMPPMPMATSYAHNFLHSSPPSGSERYDNDEIRDVNSRAAGHRPHHHGESHSRGRGRPRQSVSQRRRSSSSASSSSSSSSSSSDSDSSIGSLPDYDDLKDSQIPVARSYLEDWLSHPENSVSKAAFKEAEGSIKAAKQSKTAVAASSSERQEVRAMLGQWERVKKQQKTTRKQLRRERKAKRRAEKRERRQTRREARQVRRESKREGREARREARRERRGGPWHRRGGGCLDRGFGPAHPDHGPGFGRGHHPFGGRGPFVDHYGFPGANFGPGAQRGGSFPVGGGRGGAFQPPVPRGPWSRWQAPNEWSQRYPGAWPADASVASPNEREGVERGGQETGVDRNGTNGDGPYAVSAGMYRELEAKRAILHEKSDELSTFTADQAPAETKNKGEVEEKSGASALVGLLAEIEELERSIDRLAVDADEQYARELAMFEESRG